jgi:hypothetical protein
MPIRRFFRVLFWPAVVAVSFAAGHYSGIGFQENGTRQSPVDREIRLPRDDLIRPLLECETAELKADDSSDPFNFHPELKRFIKSVETREGIAKIALYYRDLDSGQWIGHHEDKRFSTASLYKLPVAFACMKQAAGDPKFLEKRVVFPGLPKPEMGRYHYPPRELLEKGRAYAVRDLLERMLRYSDNGAALLLNDVVGQGMVDAVIADMGIDPIRLKTKGSSLSPEEYGHFFRVLYNASYLPPADSIRLLEIMGRSTFSEGLADGVPQEITVSHKYAESMREEEGFLFIHLHDCGIVHHSKRPYLLNVMTSGNDYEAQAKAIADISRFVFDEVTRRTPSL